MNIATVPVSSIGRRAAPPGSWRLPAGHLLAAVAFAFCVLLITRMNRDHGVIVGVVGVAAAANWLAVRRRPPEN